MFVNWDFGGVCVRLVCVWVMGQKKKKVCIDLKFGSLFRLGTNGILSSSVESLSPLKGFPAAKLGPPRRLSENSDPSRRTSCCPQCQQNCEQELAKFVAKESEKPSSEVKLEGNRPPLPQWLQNAKARDGDAKTLDQAQVSFVYA